MLVPVTDPMQRQVSAVLQGQVAGQARVELQLAVSEQPGLVVEEQLTVQLDGQPVQPQQVLGDHGSRVHVLSGSGRLEVSYTATATGRAQPVEPSEQDLVAYTRPSRYAESDRLLGFAAKQFGSRRGTALVQDVSAWVGTRLSYVPGSSGPTDTATDTLLAGAGVCRDYAHLTIALLRALDTPARLVAVYAPGCDPMDFHAVTEVAVDGRWLVVDPTGLAPRQSLLRIATGRDAADTVLLTNLGGHLQLQSSVVTAVVNGDLPMDDPDTEVDLG